MPNVVRISDMFDQPVSWDHFLGDITKDPVGAKMGRDLLYQWCGLFCIGALSHSGGSVLTQESFDAHADRAELEPEIRSLLQVYMLDKYTFDAGYMPA